MESYYKIKSNTIKKCYRKIRIIKRLLPIPWDCNKKTLLHFYKSYIRPHTDYGLIVYGACAKTLTQKIERTQNYLIVSYTVLGNPQVLSFCLLRVYYQINERPRFLLINYPTKLKLIAHPPCITG